MERLIEEVTKRLFIELEASGRHVHLTKEAVQALFGHPLTPLRPLSQPGQFAAKERVTLIGPKGRMENVAVLGPERSACQVELSKTDCVALGLDAPVRQSGDIENSPGLILANGGQLFSIRQGVIVAQRHIHMTPEEAAARGLKDKQLVRLETFTERPLIFEEVLLRVSPEYTTYAHLDYDEANACGFRKGDLGRILCTTN
jgi:propanediol utilization protein